MGSGQKVQILKAVVLEEIDGTGNLKIKDVDTPEL